MRKIFAILAALSATVPAIANESNVQRWYSADSMGCMMMRECTQDVVPATTADELAKALDMQFFDETKTEIEDLLGQMKRLNIEVYVAPDKYFMRNTRGVYYTVNNKFFLNKYWMDTAERVLMTVRHEAWHAAQDCMAGTMDNSHIAIIMNPDSVPRNYHLRADIAYAGSPGIPWEREAMWAMEESYMTVNALKACKHPEGAMWDIYPPTPMTGEWLIQNGYWDGNPR